MKNTDLIAAVGGIERAREIVGGAPDGALSCGGEDGDCDYYRGGEYFDTDYSRWIEIYFETPLLHKIEDLRTAIAEHDRAVTKLEFKKGDFIVFDTTKPHCRLLPNDLMGYMRVSPNSEHDALVWVGDRLFEVGGKVIRHATPAEIEAGHRIDIRDEHEEELMNAGFDQEFVL